MSQTYEIRDHWRAFEGAAWLGMLAGVAGFLFVAVAGAPPTRAYSAMSPDQLTAWVAAICSAIMAIANTGFIIYHKFHQNRSAPKKRKSRKKQDAAPPQPG